MKAVVAAALAGRPGVGPASGQAGLTVLRRGTESFALRLVDAAGCRAWRGWSDGATALLANGDGGEIEVLAVRGLPTRLARLVDLGPRPRRRVPEIVVLEAARLEEHLGRGRAVDAEDARDALDLPPEAPDDVVAAIGALPPGLRRWTLSTSDGGLDVLDARSGYWLLVNVSEAGLCALATSSTELVWSQLVELAGRVSGRGSGER